MFTYKNNLLKSLADLAPNSQTVLLRVDFNVSFDEKTGQVLDDYRIRAAVPTIKKLLADNNKVVLCSHFGRPEGQKKLEFSFKKIVDVVAKLLEIQVVFVPNCVGEEVKRQIVALPFPSVVMLENLRFYPGEESNDPEFAQKLAELADVYVNDAFGACHRAHASIAAITKFLPSCAGLLLQKEVETLNNVLENPETPFMLIVGGRKIDDKIETIKNLAVKAEKVFIGGALANNFFKANNLPIGKSVFEETKIDVAKSLVAELGEKLILPHEVVLGRDLEDNVFSAVELGGDIENQMILDISPNNILEWQKVLSPAKLILWSGPMGYYESPIFKQGTVALAEFLSKLEAKVVIGGGDTVTGVNELGIADKFSHVSTGGGAMLEFLAGKDLPALNNL